MGNGYLEKEIALQIVLGVGKLLKQKPGIQILYTRDDDTFVELTERGAIANKANADLFVSVHCDSHSSDAYGAGTFVLGLHANKQNFEVAKKENSVIYLEDDYEIKYAQYDINSPESVIGLTVLQEEFLDQSIEVAKLIQSNFRERLKRKDRQVKQAGFIVLHQTFMPSVLVETGFLTNKEEGAYLNSKKGQSEMAKAIADAIVEYTQGIVVNTPTTGYTSTDKEQEAVVDESLSGTETSVSGGAGGTPPTAVDTKAGEISVPTEVEFKVQIMASKVPKPLRASEFNGLDILSTEKFGEYHRYMYGSTDSYREALSLQSRAKSSGYSGAYIVVYLKGERVRLTDELRRKYP